MREWSQLGAVVVGCSDMSPSAQRSETQILIQAGQKTFCRATATREVQMWQRLATGGAERA
jgi:hypothetical protein